MSVEAQLELLLLKKIVSDKIGSIDPEIIHNMKERIEFLEKKFIEEFKSNF